MIAGGLAAQRRDLEEIVSYPICHHARVRATPTVASQRAERRWAGRRARCGLMRGGGGALHAQFVAMGIKPPRGVLLYHLRNIAIMIRTLD
eukprot:COSAG01_NODE_2349_length_7856_cov_4.852520_4_plen_91_part_00